MLHELLSGANPFAARTPADVIRAHFESVPPARASAGVRAVVSKLVAREVRSRYAQTDEVIEALSAATGLALDSEGDGLAPDRVGLGQLHGREAELARIDAAARRVAAGTGARIVLVGPPGSGRSRLLHAAGAESADLLIITLDDRDAITRLARTARQNFPPALRQPRACLRILSAICRSLVWQSVCDRAAQSIVSQIRRGELS